MSSGNYIYEPKKLKLLLPKVDIIFKLLFGDMRNLEILVDFLKSILTISEDDYNSDCIRIVDPYLKRESLKDKLGIVDIKLTTKSDKIIHIEIQVLEQAEMPERITYYNSKMLATQLKSGDGYDKLQKTISIVIADFDIIKDSPSYHHVFQLYDKDAKVKFTDLVEINTLELRKIPDISDNTKKYDWLQFLNAEKEEEFQMIAQKNPIIQKAFVELKRLSQDEEALMLFEAREKAIKDENARTRAAMLKGQKEGEKKGVKKGVQKGARTEKLKIAKEMLKDDIELERISFYTKLSISELEELQRKLCK